MTATSRTIRVGLLGRGIEASSSPAIHECEAEAQGLGLSYELFDFDQLGLPDTALGSQLAQLAEEGFAGTNVTHPFKQAVIPLLDEIDPTARALGAVNCVRFKGRRVIGSNSDWIGFTFLLDDGLPKAHRKVVAQVGAGGAGSATAYSLIATGTAELRLHDQSADQVATLSARLQTAFPDAVIIVCGSPDEAISGADGVVQATPVGMAEHPGMPFDPALLRLHQWLAEVIYFPRETELLRAARQRGLATADGTAMVIGQAAEAFRLFTGVEPDRSRMLARLRRT